MEEAKSVITPNRYCESCIDTCQNKISCHSYKYQGHTWNTDTNKDKSSSDLPRNIRNDPDGILSTLPLLICPFCNFKTPIVFDMDLHLYEEHRYQLRKRFPGKKIDDILENVMMQLRTSARTRGLGQ